MPTLSAGTTLLAAGDPSGRGYQFARLAMASRMPFTFPPQTHIRRLAQHGPMLVAVGLAILIAATWWPAAPVTTAMAVVALGATHATLARLAHSQALSIVVMMHAIAYVMLYALFFGAACHAMAIRAAAGADVWRAVDLTLSVWPMAVALRLSLTAFARGRDAAGDPSGRS